MKILVAEDDPVARLITVESLNSWGYEVIEAHDGQQALDAISQDSGIKLLLIDWTMPALTGIEVCKQLKQQKEALFYIIMLTSMSGTERLVEAMDAGADDFITKPFLPEELKVRIRAGSRVLEQEEKLYFYANYDELTQVWNRRMIMHFLKVEWGRSQREGRNMAVIILDLDHFKAVNDTHGHKAGDLVLREFVKTVEGQVRPYDYFGRYGGEEFLLVMPMSAECDAQEVSERIRDAVERESVELPDGSQVKLTVSVGATIRKAADESYEATFGRADKALYSAKDGGRNTVRIL